jgi:O-antigen/teichoic acid export membrane protein
VIGGVLRLSDLSTGAAVGQPFALSVASVAHIVSMSVFCLLGAFQFSPVLRVRRGWHQNAGRVLIPAGFVAAVASVPLGVFFSGPPDERALAVVRVVFAAAMIVFLVQTVVAIRQRAFATHGAGMTRAYAIAVSGGTQALVVAVWTIMVGEVEIADETWLVAVGFVINSVVAELLIRRRVRRGSVPAPRRGSRPSWRQSAPQH